MNKRETRSTVVRSDLRSWWCTAFDGKRRIDFHGSCILGFQGDPGSLPVYGEEVTLIWSDETQTRLLSVRL